MTYTIKQVCERLGLTVHAVRHYCDSGLVPSLARDAHGNRLFDDESVNWLQATAFLRASGLSISEIKRYFDLCQRGAETIEERHRILQDLERRTEEERRAVEERLACISAKVRHYEDIMAGSCEDDCNPLNW